MLQPKSIDGDPIMNGKTLYLGWQDKRVSRAWFPVGRLDVSKTPKAYRFRYIQGAEQARLKAGFQPLFDFPELNRDYRSTELFPMFQNRIMSVERKDFAEYIQMLDLPESAEPTEILEVGGGLRATDNFEVFPRLERRDDGSFCCRFFLHGSNHVSDSAKDRVSSLKQGEPLYVTLELTNPVTRLAVQIQTLDYQMIGWAPRYLVQDLMLAMAKAPGGYKARVVRLNPSPAPSKQRLLIELSGNWQEYEPMSGEEFQPFPY